MRNILKNWAPYVTVLTVVLGTVYVAGQQMLRQSANDPQIQLAEDWAAQISNGATITGLSMGPFIDPVHSLATFGIVYDQAGNVASSSVTAPTTMLQPGGVLTAVDQAKDHQVRFTWQPESGARFATVIQRTIYADKTYYVLAARNLREIDKRQEQLMVIIFGLWLAGLVVTLASLHMHVAHRALRRLRPKQTAA